jgi:hypothetical protein
MSAFDKDRPETWPVMLKATQVAEIFQIGEPYLHRLVKAGRFTPAPQRIEHPRRWRRSDVVRAVRPEAVAS